MLLLFVYIRVAAAVAAVPTIRKRVANFLIQTNEEYSSLSLAESPDTSSSVPDEWKGECFPSYVPEDFELQPFDPNFTRVYYLNASGDLLDFAEYLTDAYVNIDTEEAIIQNIKVNGMPAILSTKGARVKVVWSDFNHYFVLTLDGDPDTAMRIVNSLERIK